MFESSTDSDNDDESNSSNYFIFHLQKNEIVNKNDIVPQKPRPHRFRPAQQIAAMMIPQVTKNMGIQS